MKVSTHSEYITERDGDHFSCGVQTYVEIEQYWKVYTALKDLITAVEDGYYGEQEVKDLVETAKSAIGMK